ncbi:MAG: hypothetical protein CBD62_01330 [Candidatus Pelagibacter sp. TMED202]|nr:MAG: hypothetical protein CBD62_01330 [Candidatus Pelagibacter sp. TMED202]
MKIIQNIKYQYQLKLLEDLFKENKFSEINSHLSEYCKKSPINGYNLLKKFIPQILNITSEEKILNDNIVLINSFEKSDCEIISKFIDYYLSKIRFTNYEVSNYQNELTSIIMSLKNLNKIEQDDIFNNSIYYQSILTYLKKDVVQFLDNQFAFFSTPANINFTNIRLSKCYFLLIEHPYNIFQKIKNKLNSKDLAINEFLNSDDIPLINNFKNVELSVIRKGWGVFTNSWSDPNVVNSLKGAIMKKEEFYDNPEEFFASIILHLRQSNFDIPLDYSLINEYVSKIKTNIEPQALNISNREKKALKKYVEIISDNFGYEL